MLDLDETNGHMAKLPRMRASLNIASLKNEMLWTIFCDYSKSRATSSYTWHLLEQPTRAN